MEQQRTKEIGTVRYYVAAAAALAAVLVYLPALQDGFVDWDDGQYIVDNRHIRSIDAALFKWAFLDFSASNWHPLTWISHALDYALWGLNPVGHHLTNIILHGINTFLVVLLSIGLLETYRTLNAGAGKPSFLEGRGVLAAGAVTGLLFGIHPVHVESVAWTAERKDLLCGLFFLLSLIAYTGHARRLEPDARGSGLSVRFTKQYLAALGFFALALLSKPMAVSLPVVLLILDWHPFGRIRSMKTFRSALYEKTPFIALSLASSVVTVFAQQSGGAIQSGEFAPLTGRLFVAATSVMLYLRNVVWPVGLVPYYPYPENQALLTIPNVSALIAVLGITVCLPLMGDKGKLGTSAWSYFLVTLLPVLGLVQVGGQAMADRYLYLPGIAPFLVLGIAAAWADARLRNPLAGVVVSVLLVALLSSLTVRQIGIWKDGITLWNYVIRHEPTAPRAYYNRGRVLAKGGQVQPAIADYDKAIELDPSFYDAYIYRGAAFREIRQPDKAIRDFDTAITVSPRDADAYVGRASVLDELGQSAKALEDYNRAIRLDPSNYEIYLNRGVLFGKTGFYGNAVEDLTRALALNPSCSPAYTARGTAYAFLGDYGRATQDFTRAIQYDDHAVLAYYNRGRLYGKTGNREAAAADFGKACAMGSSEACFEERQVLSTAGNR